MRCDLVGVLEAAYDLQGDDGPWLAKVLTAAQPALDRGMGVAAYFFAVDRRFAIKVTGHVARGIVVPPAAVRDSIEALPAEMIRSIYFDAPPCSTVAAAFRHSLRREETYKRELRQHVDVPDFLGLRGNSAPREGAILNAPLQSMGPPPPREAMLLSRLASHVGAGLRLRRRLRAEQARLDDAEAILEPDGKIAHAAGPAEPRAARGALAGAAQAVDRARGKLRRADPEEAVGLWRALVVGRWSLVDHFDHDGRRYLVAHKNQLQDPSLHIKSLSEREQQAASLAALGHSNKLIAYDLGISLSAVSDYLARAARKLGTTSRTGLVQAMRAVPEK